MVGSKNDKHKMNVYFCFLANFFEMVDEEFNK